MQRLPAVLGLLPRGHITKDTLEIDYQYCKGCGICAVECPTAAITMVKEVKTVKEEKR